MLKKRYIYSVILAAISFVVLYVILDISLVISILLTFGIYIGGILFFKEKDVRKYDPNLIMHYCYLISKFKNFSNFIDDSKIIKNIDDISVEAEKIITMLEQKPNKVTQVYDSFDYYLPLCNKIIEQYIYLKKKENLTSQEQRFLQEINQCLDNLESEFTKLLENMNYTKMLDINTQIEMFQRGNRVINDKIIKEGSDSDDARR